MRHDPQKSSSLARSAGFTARATVKGPHPFALGDDDDDDDDTEEEMLLPREHSGHQAQKRTYAILLAKRRGSTSSSSSSDRVGAPEREESSSTSKSQDGKVPVVLLGVVVVDCGIGEWRYGGVEFCCGGDETETRRCRRGERSASSINEL
jgi:hypothetical protein